MKLHARAALMLAVTAMFTTLSPRLVSAQDAPPLPDPVEYVNALPYAYRDVDMAAVAFQQVTAARGWSLADIAAWQPFVKLVIDRESGACPNLLRGARLTGVGCEMTRQGRYTDSGFGQVLMSVNGRWLCAQEGLCSKWDVIASPWNSMTALVATVERGGRGPWCYTAKLRRGYACRIAPGGRPGR